MIKKIAEKILDIILKKSPCFQDYINNRYNRVGFSPIDTSILEGAIVSYKGNKYHFTDRIQSLKWCESDYDFSDITKDEVVLDIGAEFGALSIPISKKCKHVYAIEIDPKMRKILRDNIKLNNIKNITVFNIGLKGNEEMHTFNTQLKSLSEILKQIEEKPTFLKLDCEGAEWNISITELKKFKRIEGEIHNLKGFGVASGKGKHNLDFFLDRLYAAGFDIKYSKYHDIIMIIHAKRKR